MSGVLTTQPIPYQGSKRNIALTILYNFPDEVNCLLEPFAGSAAISLAAAHRKKASSFIINDSYKPLMELWKMILDDPEQCIDGYSKLWNEQLDNPNEFYFQIREEFNKDNDPVKFLYLMTRCAKNAVRFNSKGEFNQSPDKRRLGRKPGVMRDHIMSTHNLLQGKTMLKSLDYEEILEMAKPGDLVYMDPPYQGTSTKKDPRYHQGLDFDRFVSNLEKLNERGVSFIVSFDGKLGEKEYGKPLPDYLNLSRIEVHAGRSSQSTLNGKNEKTIESLYVSQTLEPKIVTQLSLIAA
jgi:DNA adenine methylase